MEDLFYFAQLGVTCEQKTRFFTTTIRNGKGTKQNGPSIQKERGCDPMIDVMLAYIHSVPFLEHRIT